MSSKKEKNDDEVYAITIRKYYKNLSIRIYKQLTSTKIQKCTVELKKQYQALLKKFSLNSGTRHNVIIKQISNQKEVNVWKFKLIVAHEVPLIAYNINFKGSWYNVMVEWETGETTA